MQRRDKFLILTFEQDVHGNFTKLPFPYGSSVTIEVPEGTNIVIEKEQLGNTVKTHLFGVVESRWCNEVWLYKGILKITKG